MTHPDHEPDEAGLRALFDATADELDGPGLTKLRARAADIPARRRPAWWKLWSPVFAVAMGGLLVFGIRTLNQPSAPGPVATTAAVAPSATELVAKSAPTPTPETAPSEEEEPEELALGEEVIDDETSVPDDELVLDDGSDDLLAFGVPSDDEELDAWLEATDELLGEGG
jgi:hypothetical protein